jgi:hypothetical protein
LAPKGYHVRSNFLHCCPKSQELTKNRTFQNAVNSNSLIDCWKYLDHPSLIPDPEFSKFYFYGSTKKTSKESTSDNDKTKAEVHQRMPLFLLRNKKCGAMMGQISQGLEN